jgi:hypothetical protein
MVRNPRLQLMDLWRVTVGSSCGERYCRPRHDLARIRIHDFPGYRS